MSKECLNIIDRIFQEGAIYISLPFPVLSRLERMTRMDNTQQ